MPGPKRTPRHLRLLRGTLQPCRDVAQSGPSLPVLDAVPTPPSWLTNIAALAEWNKIAPVLFANKMLTVGKIRTLADWCALGAVISGAWLTNSTPSAALMSVHRKLAGDLGLSAMILPASNDKPNRFLSNALRPRR